MRQLLIGIVVVFVVGLVGFLYRYDIEESGLGVAKVADSVQIGNKACTADAKICPDGTAVGRTGPNCSFAECAPPNVELVTGSTTIGFVLPPGYASTASSTGVTSTNSAAPNGSLAESLIGEYAKTSESSTPHLVKIYDYQTPQDQANAQTGEQVMLAHTIFSPSGTQATTTDAFSTVQIAGEDFNAVTTMHSGGEVDSSYFLIRSHDVLRFEIDEQNVASSTDPNLNITALPEHQSLLQMLATLQITST